MSDRTEDERRPEHPRRTEDRRWMAEFDEELRRLHLEGLQPRGLRSVVLSKLRDWWRRVRRVA
jgi:hypothetical protein